jgi:molybdopterin-dependent oxidoreductase alpha subunit
MNDAPSEPQKDENSADNQRDENTPRAAWEERPMETPPLSRRTDGAQYPMNDDYPETMERDLVASGWTALFQTYHFARKYGAGRTLRSLLVLNHKGGIDCSSCAWPEPDATRHPAEFCENGAKAIAWEATDKTVGPDFFAKHSVAELAERSEMWLGDQGRLTHPMVLRRNSQHYEPISWDDAFAMIAAELNGLESPNEAAFYTSGRASNEAAFCYGLFARQFGTNNLPDCSNMCHESTSLGLSEQIGIGKATVTIEDFERADLILITGQNPGTNHPRMLTMLERCVEKGGKIISINPLNETGLIRFRHPQKVTDMLGPGTKLASEFVQVKVNGDMALFKGLMKVLLDMDDASQGKVFDHDFIREKTVGYGELAQDLRRTEWPIVEEQSGIPRARIEEIARLIASSKRLISCWAMGITQHHNGVENVQTLCNLNLLLGMIGKPGAGVCPVRGHSNVQGDRTVGIWEKMSPQFLGKLAKEFGFSPPENHGHDSVATAQAMHEGAVKVFVGLGGNFLSAMADTEYTAEAFRRTRLSVQISTKLNRGHLITGEQALILPCLARTDRDVQAEGEQFVSTENTMGVVQMSKGILQPLSGDMRSEPNIICHIAHATLKDAPNVGRGVDWLGLTANYDRIRQHIEHVVPGFSDYNVRVRQHGGFYLPNAAREKREFHNPQKKAVLYAHPLPRRNLAPDQLLLTCLRSHDQFNTTIYGEVDRYRGIRGGRHVLFMNASDIAARGLAAGQWVDITSHYEQERRTVRRFKIVEYDIPKGCAAMYYPEQNPLVPLRQVAKGSNQPASKSLVVTVALSSKQ